MRDRLVEMLCNVKCEGEESFGNCPHRIGQKCNKVQRLEMCSVFAIADHLLAEGVIVPKVKIGDKLYELSASKTKLYEVAVTHLEVHENDIRIWGKKPQCQEIEWICSQSDLGNNEWVYLTREEAEKALAERSKE